MAQKNSEMTPEQVELFLANEQLVPWTIWRYFGSKIPKDEREDYISVGRIGLVQAVKTYKPESGVKFSTYATRCIKNQIARDLNMTYTVKRTPPGPLVSLDEEILDDAANPTLRGDLIPDSYSLEEHVEVREQLRLALLDPGIRTMVTDLCSPEEAAKKIGISKRTFNYRKGAIYKAIKQFQEPPKLRKRRKTNDKDV